MQKELLNGQLPKKFLCPFCGKWHKWDDSSFPPIEAKKLIDYDSPTNSVVLTCTRREKGYNTRAINVYFWNGYCFYKIWLSFTNIEIESSVCIESISESYDEFSVKETFKIPFGVNHLGLKNSQFDESAIQSTVFGMNSKFGFEFEKNN